MQANTQARVETALEGIYEVITKPTAIYDDTAREQHYKKEIKRHLDWLVAQPVGYELKEVVYTLPAEEVNTQTPVLVDTNEDFIRPQQAS